MQGVGRAGGDAAQVGFDLGPRRLNRVEIGRVGRQVAVGEAGAIEQPAQFGVLWAAKLSRTSTASGWVRRNSGSSTWSR